MHINWIQQKISGNEDIDSLITAEYTFRSRITRMLLERMKDYNELDLELISFDFDTDNKSFKVSSSTPEPIYSELLKISDGF